MKKGEKIMKKISCVKERNVAGCRLVVGRDYYMDESTRYTDSDGDEYACVYADDKKEFWVGNLSLVHFCMTGNGNCLACDMYDTCCICNN